MCCRGATRSVGRDGTSLAIAVAVAAVVRVVHYPASSYAVLRCGDCDIQAVCISLLPLGGAIIAAGVFIADTVAAGTTLKVTAIPFSFFPPSVVSAAGTAPPAP